MSGVGQTNGGRPVSFIFHIAAEADWTNTIGPYLGDSLKTEEFIHCSTSGQLTAVSNRFFRGRQDLIVLVIDPTRVVPTIVYENLEGGNELFPHIYGPLDVDAVVSTFPLKPGRDGTFEEPAELANWIAGPLNRRSDKSGSAS